ncbi:hypothetical protein [Nosocomiicoccus massiliensis]|uniref:Lipoprotein n=1 Tax=Nosocomiicoccus massiliensis TaxID=1232430 RepID=A0AAF1BNJ3_9STAP|nr:hypothetical protein [Nosocomiicoccus massiliensis]WOS96859.1 hypothetical protein CJ229_003880 [Nosocomiicoccus massiliensis]
MNKTRFILLNIVVALFLTSCQAVEQAIEDTFRKSPEKLNKEDSEQSLTDTVKGLFLDESNEVITSSDIIKDAEEKYGTEFDVEINRQFDLYLKEENINRYLSEEEIMEIINVFKSNNLLTNRDKRDEIMESLFELVGTREFYVYEGRIMLNSTNLYVYVVDPNNTKHVDLYYYNMSIGSWSIIPEKLKEDVDPVTASIQVSQFNFDSYEKIVDTAIEILKDMGEYDESTTIINDNNIATIQSRFDGNDVSFNTLLKGTREDYHLTFDHKGNLIKKERI